MSTSRIIVEYSGSYARQAAENDADMVRQATMRRNPLDEPAVRVEHDPPPGDSMGEATAFPFVHTDSLRQLIAIWRKKAEDGVCGADREQANFLSGVEQCADELEALISPPP